MASATPDLQLSRPLFRKNIAARLAQLQQILQCRCISQLHHLVRRRTL